MENARNKVTFRACVAAAVLVGAGAGAGCGGGAPASAPYRPPVDIDAGGTDLSSPDAGTDVVELPPVAGAGTMRILSGPVTFISSGPPCTNEIGSSGDAWCAFLRPSVQMPGADALYVVNITQAYAGKAVDCGTTAGDANCLLLTGGFGSDAKHAAAFHGNTLVYYDVTATPYGWRPGMLNGRRLAVVTGATGDAHDCVSARMGDTVACVQDVPAPPSTGDPATDPDASANYGDLLVGRVGPNSPVLAKVATVITSDASEDLSHFQFRIGSPTSDWIAWSSRATVDGPEVLKIQKVGDDASRQVVATDVSRWSTSPDGTQWAWLSAFNYDSQGPSGTLQAAAFPDGLSPVPVVEAAASFSFVGDHGLVALDHHGQLFGIAAPTAAATASGKSKLDSGVIGMVALSAQGHVAYAKDFDFIFRLVDLYVKKFDGTGSSCGLDTRTEVPFGGSLAPRFLPSGRAMLWSRITNLDTDEDRLVAAGKFTRLSDCATETVEPDIVGLGTLGDEGVSLSDSFGGDSGTLRIRGVTSAGTLAPGDATLVQTRVDTSLSLFPFLRVLLYTVNIGDPADGLYVRPIAASTAAN